MLWRRPFFSRPSPPPPKSCFRYVIDMRNIFFKHDGTTDEIRLCCYISLYTSAAYSVHTSSIIYIVELIHIHLHLPLLVENLSIQQHILLHTGQSHGYMYSFLNSVHCISLNIILRILLRRILSKQMIFHKYIQQELRFILVGKNYLLLNCSIQHCLPQTSVQ